MSIRTACSREAKSSPYASKPSPVANSVAWLLLRAKSGTAMGSLASVAYIRRTETVGGVPPATCESSKAVEMRVNYSATYTFYAAQ